MNLENQWQETFPKGSQFSDMSGIQHFINLRSLSIAWNNGGGYRKARETHAAGVLHAFGNRIADLTPLSGLTRLDNVNVGGNQVKSVYRLAGLTNLAESVSGRQSRLRISARCPA